MFLTGTENIYKQPVCKNHLEHYIPPLSHLKGGLDPLSPVI